MGHNIESECRRRTKSSQQLYLKMPPSKIAEDQIYSSVSTKGYKTIQNDQWRKPRTNELKAQTRNQRTIYDDILNITTVECYNNDNGNCLLAEYRIPFGERTKRDKLRKILPQSAAQAIPRNRIQRHRLSRNSDTISVTGNEAMRYIRRARMDIHFQERWFCWLSKFRRVRMLIKTFNNSQCYKGSGRCPRSDSCYQTTIVPVIGFVRWPWRSAYEKLKTELDRDGRKATCIVLQFPQPFVRHTGL